MNNWRKIFLYDPIPSLGSSENKAIKFFVDNDLLHIKDRKIQILWELPEPVNIIRKQQLNGSWRFSGGKERIRSQDNYDQIETYRNLGILIEKFGFNKNHPAIQKAAEFLFSFQTKEGDFRGIYGNQYTPNYSAGIMELLIKAGYIEDHHIESGFKWLISIRQNDGGWAIPLRTHKQKLDIISLHAPTLLPDKSKPFSHLVTGIVLRAFAVHPKYKNHKIVKVAGNLFLSNILKKDNYPERGTPAYWLRFSFPFWFTDLLSALDSLSLLNFSMDEPSIKKGIQWFIDNQLETGLWRLKLLRDKDKDLNYWLALTICKVIKRLCD